MFRRSRLSVRPNVKPGGRGLAGSSQAPKQDDKPPASDQQASPEEKATNEKDVSENSGTVPVPSPPSPPPNSSAEQDQRDGPDEQQENVPLNKKEKNDKNTESSAGIKSSAVPLQRRKRIATMPNLAKQRSATPSANQSTTVTPKSPPRKPTPLSSVSNAVSLQETPPLSQTTTPEKPLPKSPEKRRASSGQQTKLPEKKTPIPQVPQFSPVKKSSNKDSTSAANSPRADSVRKALASPLKERVTPSPGASSTSPKGPKLPSEVERLRKARKLREMLKEELRKEKGLLQKSNREKILLWESGTPPERTKMTMRDFIYYLPETNPMQSSLEEERRQSEKVPAPVPVSVLAPVLTKEPELENTNASGDDEDDEGDDSILGPRVKVAEDGTIIIDEESLTVEVLRMKGPNIAENNDPIFERGSQTTYSSFRRNTHTKPWSNKETDMFFLAISMVGTDFSMIGQLFPNRSRVEIKNKFKREEKLNSWRIDKAFKETKPLDLEFFGELLTKVLEAETKRKRERNGKNKHQAPRKSSVKQKKKGKKLPLGETESDPDDPDPVEGSSDELAETDPSAVEERTEASHSVEEQEEMQEKETASKASLTKGKRKRKKKDVAEITETESAEGPSLEDTAFQKSKQTGRQQSKKGIQNASDLSSGESSLGGKVAKDGDDMHTVDGEMSCDPETTENKQTSPTKRKQKSIPEDKSASDHESVTSSESSSAIPAENSEKTQHSLLQKPKPNLKLTGRKGGDGKGSEKPASETTDSCDDQNSDKLNDQSVQVHDPPCEEVNEIVGKEMPNKDIVSVMQMPETTEVAKPITQETPASQAHDSGTESSSVEKLTSHEECKEPRSKTGPPVRSRSQRPKPNLGKAAGKKDVPAQKRKIVAEEATESSPKTPDNEGNKPMTPDTCLTPVSEGPSLASVLVSSDPVESEKQNAADLDSMVLRKDSVHPDKVQQPERPLESDNQEEQEELNLETFQEKIINKPTRSGRQPKAPAFYNPPVEQKSSTASTSSEGENESRGRGRQPRSQKPKSKASKGSAKKDAQTKNASKGQGQGKMTLVTLRASQDDDEDDEPEAEEEDDMYPFSPEEVNKAPAFVPISLRSPEPFQPQVEESMEELEIAVNVSDRTYDSDPEQPLPVVPDKHDPSQSSTPVPEGECNPSADDQVNLFVEVFEIASEEMNKEKDPCSVEPSDTCIAEPGDPRIAEPGDARIAEPGDARIAEPGDPRIAEPGDPRIAEPGDPRIAEPGDPRIAEPGDPRIAEPGDPRIAEPGDPPIAEPGDAPIAEPGDAPIAEPGAPRIAEPGAPRIAEPGAPRIAEPGAPPIAEPGAPRIAEPGAPPIAEPGAPRIAEPGAPRIAEPSEPGRRKLNDSCSTKLCNPGSAGLGDGLHNTEDTHGTCANQKIVDQASVHGGDPSLQTAETIETEIKSRKADEQNVSTGRDVKDALLSEKEKPTQSKEDSSSRSFSASSAIEVNDDTQGNRAVGKSRRSRFLKPRPNLSKNAARRHVKEQPCSGAEMVETQSSNAPSAPTSERTKHADEMEMKSSDSLQIRLLGGEGDEQDKTREQSRADQPADETLLITEKMYKYMEDKKQMIQSEPLSERTSPGHDLLLPVDQNQETGERISSDSWCQQPTVDLCQTSDTRLSSEVAETSVEVSSLGYDQKIDVMEAKDMEHQGMNTFEGDSENLMAIGSSKEETFILTLVEIPTSSLNEYDPSSTSFMPLPEAPLAVVEPVISLPMENIEDAEAVSTEPLVEAPDIVTVADRTPLIKASPQRRCLNKPKPNLHQMGRKRNAPSVKNCRDAPPDKNSTTVAPNTERCEEIAPQVEEASQSSLTISTSPEKCPVIFTTNMSGNYDVAPSEPNETCSSALLNNVDPLPVENVTDPCSELADEPKKLASRIRRSKLSVKPNFSAKRTAATCEPKLPAGNKPTQKLSKSSGNASRPQASQVMLETEPICNSATDVNSEQEPESLCHLQVPTDIQETAATTETVDTASERLAEDVAEPSEINAPNTASSSRAPLTRPGRKPRGFLSFISKKSSESETKPKRTKFQKPRMNVPRIAGKRSAPSPEDTAETEASLSLTAKRKSLESQSASLPDTSGAPSEVAHHSSVQCWQSESYKEEAFCAGQQDTEEAPTRVAEYFFSDIFTEVEDLE
eukprot:gi/632963653/ref/XP_007898001.1/ PREDICTED: transcription factor TFIIIB component B'' homolog [Callorhinchus milii]